MVAIVIIAVLASLAFMVGGRAMKKAKASAELSTIRNCGIALNSMAADLRYFPMGYDSNTGKSWASLIADDLHGSSEGRHQAEILWSPVFGENIPMDAEVETVSHFACNPAIMTDVDGNSRTEPKEPKFRIRMSQLRRPSEQILLCGAVSRGAEANYRRAHAMLWQMRSKVGGNGGNGNPPSLNPNNSQRTMDFGKDLTVPDVYGSLPDFYRYGNGKGLFLFVDGSARFMSPDEHRQKHWASNY